MKRKLAIYLLLALVFSQLTYAEAASTTEVTLAAVFGGLSALFLIVLLLYCCSKRCCRKRRSQGKSLVTSVEEGDGQRFGEMSVNDMNDAESLSVEQSQHGSQRILRASIEMPVLSAVTNIGLSTSEEGLAVNGNAQTGDQTQSSQVEEQRVFVFVEKQPGDSLGLYLVPFEEEPLTGLFVKTVVPGKSAARLQVFDPGDKIVTVNGKPLAGLSYREATDFIRQCSGPNVKMGIIKHAIYKKEDLEKLDSMSAYRHSANIDGDFNVGGALSLGQTSDVDTHPTAFRLSGSTTKNDVHGGTVADGATKIAIEAPVMVQKSDASYNVESMPDLPQGNLEDNLPKLGYDIELSGGLGRQAVDTNANMGGKLPGSGMDVDIDGQNGVDTDISFPAGGTSGKAEVKFPDTSSSSETKVYGVDLEVPKDSKFSLKRYFSGSKSKEARVSSSDESSPDKKPGKFGKFFGRKSASGKVNLDTSAGESGKMEFEMGSPRAGGEFEGEFVKRSDIRDVQASPGDLRAGVDFGKVKGPDYQVESPVKAKAVSEVHSANLATVNLPSVGFGTGLKGDGSSSDTSDGQGGRIKRKFKTPRFGVGVEGSGDVGRSKPDESSGSETSDGQGGRIKRKFKLKGPKFGFGGGISGRVKESKPDDDSGSETSDGEGGRIKRRFKTPKPGIGFAGGLSGKTKEHEPGYDSDSETSDGEGGRIKRKLKLKRPKFGVGGGISGEVKGSKQDDSGSETSDGEGGKIKRKLKRPKFGFGIGIGGNKGSKPGESSGSETSDGEGGRIKRKLKLKGPKFGTGGGISGGVEGPKPDDDSGSETSDGQGGRIKRKLKGPKIGFGIEGGASGKVKGSKPEEDSGSETSDGEGGRTKRKFKLPKFGFGMGGRSG